MSHATKKCGLVQALILVCGGLAVSSPAHAIVTMSVVQSGANVVVTASGTADVSGLTSLPSSITFPSGVYNGSYGSRLLTGSGLGQDYLNLTGPGFFGTHNSDYTRTDATVSTGDAVGIWEDRQLMLPFGYVSGSSISATSTFANATIGSLGLIAGSYTWTWGSAANADSLVINIAGPVPEPETFALMFVGIVMVGTQICRGRRSA